MTNSVAEELFQVLDSTTVILQDALEISYLEALYETGENLFQHEVLQVEEVSAEQVADLKKAYASVALDDYTPEDIRRALQLALLKGMKHGIQTNHQMTPDSIGFILAYFIEKLTKEKAEVAILDPACGTGNLISTITNQLLLTKDKVVQATGIEVDDLLISLALVSSDLQGQRTHLLHQDGLSNLLVDPADIVVSDLPVGYYPDDERANTYELKQASGHSFAHYLFIEQGMRYTKPGGYLFFLVPDSMFADSEFPRVDRFIKKHGHMQGIIKLPETLFKSEQSRKSILILQKQSAETKAPKEVLLANLPTLSDPAVTAPILSNIEKWFNENK
ncbi:class I SAM-dependent methyltransferase [Listeria grayi]|uniref:class I SAM-dependent methyltransferase n=1 Tax=Listeria grayi TaxID=1641 RepID=UPI001C8A690E